MTKKIAVINDLSGFGRCSLTAAIPVISAMGIQACPVPTAILSKQTGFPEYYCDSRPEYLSIFREDWKKSGSSFDGIYTGFVTDEAQARAIADFIDTFDHEGCQILVDPILGDDGEPYKFYNDSLCSAMRELAGRASLITPNLTELCLLAGVDPSSLIDADWDLMQEKIISLCSGLCAGHSLSILVTGIRHRAGGACESEEASMIANGIYKDGSWTACDAPLLPGSFSGTGDLFASIIIASQVKGTDLTQAVRKAQDFLTVSIQDSVAEKVYPPEGTNFEKYLSMLMDF